MAHNQENIARAEAELAESESRSGGLAKQAEEQEARVAEIDRQIEELNASLNALLEQAQAMAEQAGGAHQMVSKLCVRIHKQSSPPYICNTKCNADFW